MSKYNRELLNQYGKIASKLIEDHGLTRGIYSKWHWTFDWDSNTKRTGVCNHTERWIMATKKYVEKRGLDAFKNTILHEIAHALVGKGHKHDDIWKKKAIEIGCNLNKYANYKD